MGLLFSLSKCLLLSFNLICLILGIGALFISASGLQSAKPGTEEHTYFIVGIILGAFVCISCLFGFYGVLGELIAVNVVYSCFVLMLLILQYLQMKAFQPQTFLNHAVQHMQNSWKLVEVQPNHMQALQYDYHCCGYNNSSDYSAIGLSIPPSCYYIDDVSNLESIYARGCLDALKTSYQFAVRRERLFSWALMTSEAIVFMQSVLISIVFYRKRHSRPQAVVQPMVHIDDGNQWNHVHSRTNLLFD